MEEEAKETEEQGPVAGQREMLRTITTEHRMISHNRQLVIANAAVRQAFRQQIASVQGDLEAI